MAEKGSRSSYHVTKPLLSKLLAAWLIVMMSMGDDGCDGLRYFLGVVSKIMKDAGTKKGHSPHDMSWFCLMACQLLLK